MPASPGAVPMLLLAALLVPGVARAQPDPDLALPWPENAALLALEEIDGSTLEGLGVRVIRTHGERSGMVTVPHGSGWGTVFDLAPHPEGLTFVAAENGLFVVSHDNYTADMVDVRSGAPRGYPAGVHVDSRGVLWVATDLGFGCVDTDELWGRTFTSGDLDASIPLTSGVERPRLPFTGLAVQPDGTFVLYTRDQAFAYVPGQLARPRLEVIRVGGRPYDRGRRFTASARLPLEVRVETDSSVALRYRLGHDLRSWPLSAARPVLPSLPQGTRVVELVAVDRELQESEPVLLNVHVPPPRRQDPVWLGVGVAFGELAMGAVLLVLLRRRSIGRVAAIVAALASLGIGVQVLLAASEQTRRPAAQTFWRHVDSEAKRGVIYKLVVLGTGAAGEEFEIPPADVGWDEPADRPGIVTLVHGSEGEPDRVLDRLASRYASRSLRGVEVVARRFRLTERGPVPVAPLLLARHRVGGG